jgi:hypothetical protein
MIIPGDSLLNYLVRSVYYDVANGVHDPNYLMGRAISTTKKQRH